LLVGILHLRLVELMRRNNIEKAKELLKKAKDKGVKMVILPSLFPVGNVIEVYDNTKRLRSLVKNLSEKIPGQITTTLIDLATESEMYVMTGSIVEQAGPKVFLTSLFINPYGEIIGKYRKVITSPRERELGIASGKEPVTMDLERKVGVLLEDDLLTPEIGRLLKLYGANMLYSVMKPWPLDFSKALESSATAMAVQLGLPVVVAGGEVVDKYNNFLGGAPSMVVLPDGSVYDMAEKEDSLLTFESVVLLQKSNSVRRMTDTPEEVFEICKGIRKLADERARSKSQVKWREPTTKKEDEEKEEEELEEG
jgi:predicted amidohydrolase